MESHKISSNEQTYFIFLRCHKRPSHDDDDDDDVIRNFRGATAGVGWVTEGKFFATPAAALREILGSPLRQSYKATRNTNWCVQGVSKPL